MAIPHGVRITKTPRGSPGDGCVYSRQTALRLLVSGGPAWTPGQEDRVWGHTKFLSIYYRLLAQRNKEGDRGRENGSLGLSYPRNQASQPSWNGVGQQGGGGQREGQESGKEPGTELSTHCQGQLCS